MEAHGGWRTRVTPELQAFLAERDSAYLATVNGGGQPYIQHRGGPRGFIRVIDERTLGFVDFVGNRQYITTGNLQENPKAFLFLMDYAQRRRIKIWGRAHVEKASDRLVQLLMPLGCPAPVQQVIVFAVDAWDVNCPQHIPQKFGAADVENVLGELRARIAALETENTRLRAAVASIR